MEATAPSVDPIPHVPSVQTAEQQDVTYERLRRVNGTHNNLCGWFKQHKILAVVVLTVLVTMVITSGIIVGVMMAVTKENTAVVKQDTDKSESSPATTLMVTKESTDNDVNTQTPVTMKDNINDDTKVGTDNDITTGTETQVTSQPIETTPSVASGNTASLIVIGGYWRGESLNTVDIYGLDSGRIEWSHQGELCPFTGYLSGRAVDTSNVYVIGGATYRYGVFSLQYRVARYSVVSNTWEQLPNMTQVTGTDLAVFIHEDTLHTAYNRDIWTLDLSQASAGTWTEENINLPHYVRGRNAVVTVGGRVFIIGKYVGYSKSVISWRPGTDEQWISVADMNVGRWSHELCSVTDGVDRIWVMAGCRHAHRQDSLKCTGFRQTHGHNKMLCQNIYLQTLAKLELRSVDITMATFMQYWELMDLTTQLMKKVSTYLTQWITNGVSLTLNSQQMLKNKQQLL